MKALKKIALISMLAIGGLSSMTMMSCGKEDEACAVGLEGSDCKTEMRTKFINASGWTATETGSASGASTYTAQILTSNAGTDKVLVRNLYGLFTNDVTATVNGSTFTIARQEPDGDKFFVTGSGTISSAGAITVQYTVTDETSTPVVTDAVSGTWIKK